MIIYFIKKVAMTEVCFKKCNDDVLISLERICLSFLSKDMFLSLYKKQGFFINEIINTGFQKVIFFFLRVYKALSHSNDF